MNKKIIVAVISIAVILVIAVMSLTLFTDDVQGSKNTNKAKIHLVLDHGLDKTISIRITLDRKVIFRDSVDPVDQMPPIVFSENFNLSKGNHVLVFEDTTRNIREQRRFNVPDTESILIQTQKVDTHIVLRSEPLGIK